MRWLRLNVSFDDSPWLFVLSAESQLAWVKLLCHIKRDGMNGRCKSLSPIVAGKKWGVGDEAVTKLLQAAVIDGAIIIEDGHWILSNWGKYQDNDATTNERSKRYRERQKEPNSDEKRHGASRRDFRDDCRVTETETETKTKKRTSSSCAGERFVAPTLERVVDYMKSRKWVNPELEAEGFIAYQEARGWMMGKSPIKNWEQCVITFEVARKKAGKWLDAKQVRADGTPWLDIEGYPPEGFYRDGNPHPAQDVDFVLVPIEAGNPLVCRKYCMDGVTPFSETKWKQEKYGK